MSCAAIPDNRSYRGLRLLGAGFETVVRAAAFEFRFEFADAFRLRFDLMPARLVPDICTHGLASGSAQCAAQMICPASESHSQPHGHTTCSTIPFAGFTST
jgi:hypothetical protein